MSTEFEVYSPTFDEILMPVVCATQEEADKVKGWLRDVSGQKFGTSCNWQTREVDADKRPIPPKASVVTPVQVDEVRKLMAKHGQDCIVVLAWSATGDTVNVATAGSDRSYSECAYAMGKRIAAAAGCEVQELMFEDRRDEHHENPS